MKKTLKLCLICLLSTLFLLPTGLLAAAENGPCDAPFFTYLQFIELDQNGEPITEIVDGYEQYKMTFAYANNEPQKVDGAVYDKEKNTLTLTDFNHPEYSLTARMMGDDFTLCVKGSCALAKIVISGEEWGGSLHIAGDGALTVNEAKKQECGILLSGVYVKTLQFTIDASVKLNVYGTKTAVEVYGYSGDFSIKVGSSDVKIGKKPAVRDQVVMLTGYSDPGDYSIPLCKNAADSDGIYGLHEWVTDEGETSVTVEHYIYLQNYDMYVVDHNWKEANQGKGSGILQFDTLEAAAAAGYTPVKNAEGDTVWKDVNTMDQYGTEQVYQDANGNRYVKGSGYNDNGEWGEFAMTIVPLDEVEGEYIFFFVPGLDPATLTEVRETVTLEDTFDYSFPSTEFILQIETDFVPGDVNNDGRVTAADARLALRRAVGLETYAPESREFKACDVDGNGKITAADARKILRAAVGLETLK